MVPGNLEAWEQILRQKTDSKVVRQWAKRANHWKDSDQLVEALFAFSRQGSEEGPLKIFLMLNAIDSARPEGQRLSPQTVRLLGDKFARYGNQYLIFSEFHGLNDDSITRFLSTADAIDHISNVTLRANALGIFQANVGLWQILARQGANPCRQTERILARCDRSFRWRHAFVGPVVRFRANLGSGIVAGIGGQGQIFPRTK